MVAITSKIGLPWHAYSRCVGNVVGFVLRTSVIAVGFVVSWSNHVWLRCGDDAHLIVEVVENPLVDFCSALDGGVGKEALDFFLEPVICVCDVSNCCFQGQQRRKYSGKERLTVPQEVKLGL